MNKVEIKRLDNCVHIVTEKIPGAKSYSLGFWFNAGSRDENSKNNGISHFIEHMLFKGTPTRNARKISTETEKHGTYLNAFTSKENTCFYARGLHGSFGKSFEILADMLLNPLFSEKEIKKEANVIADELSDILDTPEEFIFDEFEKTIYANSSLGFPVIGTRENIFGFNKKDFFEHYKKYYFARNLYIVVVGDFSVDEVIKFAEKYIKGNFCGKKLPRRKPKNSCSKFTTIYRGINQYYSIIGSQAVGFTHPDYYKMRLLSIILGEGSSSRLFIKLREEKGIAYQINSFVNSYSDISTFGVYFSTNPEFKKKATDLIFKELENLAKGNVRKSELEKAKKILITNIILGAEEFSNRMTRMANAYIYSGKIKSFSETEKELALVTLSEINDYAEKFFAKENFSQVEVTDYGK